MNEWGDERIWSYSEPGKTWCEYKKKTLLKSIFDVEYTII